MAEVPSRIVGRERELAAIREALADVRSGASRAVGLRGEPGIGKSRLLLELAHVAGSGETLVLAGRATELERDLPFALLADALDAPAAARADALCGLDAGVLGELAAVLPAFARAAGIAPVTAAGERHLVARSVRELLTALARDRPVALLLDDVQWADPVSEDVLALLLHRPPPARVLLAMAMRAGRAPALEAALGQTARTDATTLIELGPLPRSAVETLLPGARPAARDRLYRESGGNPFFLEELARTTPAVDGAAHHVLPGVPFAVRAALAGEVRAVSAPGRLLLESAAVAGDPFEVELAAAVAGLDERAALDALDELLEADLVRPTDQARRFRFRHPLVLRAVYEGAAGGWRLAAHARASELLAARGASPGRRAHHAERAGRLGDLDTVDLLAEAATEVGAAAPATAAAWLEAAMRLLPEAPEHGPRRLELLGKQAEALASAGRVLDAREALRRLLGMLPAEAAAERVATAVALTDLDALWTDQPEAARRMLHAERERLGDAAPGLSAALSLAMARERAENGDRAAALALADSARAGAREAGDRVLEADAAVAAADAAHCALRQDDPVALAAVDRRLAEAGELVAALGDHELAQRLTMLIWLGVARLWTGDLPGGHAAADHGLALARSTRQGVLASAFVVLRAYADQELGRLDEAQAGAEEALESGLISGGSQVAFFASAVLSWTALMRGRPDAAVEHGQAMLEYMGAAPYNQAGSTIADARLALGDPQGALAALDASGWVRPEMVTFDRVRAAEVAVRVLLALGRVDEAAEWAGRIAAEGGGRRTSVFGAAVALAEAGVLLARGEAAGAARAALGGATAADRGSAPVWASRCRVLAGEALAAAGDGAQARAELHRAVAQLEARGAWGHRDAALRVLRRLGDRPRVPVVTGTATLAGGPLSALTPREREVAELVGDGQTNAQIAARLQLSERTVEKHVSSVIGKLGVPSRTGVVRLLASVERRAGAGAATST